MGNVSRRKAPTYPMLLVIACRCSGSTTGLKSNVAVTESSPDYNGSFSTHTPAIGKPYPNICDRISRRHSRFVISISKSRLRLITHLYASVFRGNLSPGPVTASQIVGTPGPWNRTFCWDVLCINAHLLFASLSRTPPSSVTTQIMPTSQFPRAHVPKSPNAS